MQTFIPTGEDFLRTAVILDRQRLGKQRVEGLQILNTLTGRSTGWSNHPAVKMWRGHEESLAHYTLTMCNVWIAKGYKDTIREKIKDMFPTLTPAHLVCPPSWLGEDKVTLSHRSNLIRKKPEYYGLFWPEVQPDLPYVWPV